MRVKPGSLYTYSPVGFDRVRPCTGNTLELDQIVRVISLPSAPRANTMGQCYVADPYTCKFICMVQTSSLKPLRTIAPDLVSKVNRKARHESAAYGRCACGKRVQENSKIPPYHSTPATRADALTRLRVEWNGETARRRIGGTFGS